jgi:hypothetical protein
MVGAETRYRESVEQGRQVATVRHVLDHSWLADRSSNRSGMSMNMVTNPRSDAVSLARV